MKAKERYMQMRNEGLTNQQIAEVMNLKKSTIDRAIGSDKKIKEEKAMGINSKVSQPRVVKTKKEKFYTDPIEGLEPGVKPEVIKTKTVNCSDCGKTFPLYPAEQRFYNSKGFPLPKRCPDCREKRKKVQVKICCDCGTEFEITRTQREYFEKNGLNLPKRCPECLEHKRERNKLLQEKDKKAANVHDKAADAE